MTTRKLYTIASPNPLGTVWANYWYRQNVTNGYDSSNINLQKLNANLWIADMRADIADPILIFKYWLDPSTGAFYSLYSYQTHQDLILYTRIVFTVADKIVSIGSIFSNYKYYEVRSVDESNFATDLIGNAPLCDIDDSYSYVCHLKLSQNKVMVLLKGDLSSNYKICYLQPDSNGDIYASECENIITIPPQYVWNIRALKINEYSFLLSILDSPDYSATASNIQIIGEVNNDITTWPTINYETYTFNNRDPNLPNIFLSRNRGIKLGYTPTYLQDCTNLHSPINISSINLTGYFGMTFNEGTTICIGTYYANGNDMSYAYVLDFSNDILKLNTAHYYATSTLDIANFISTKMLFLDEETVFITTVGPSTLGQFLSSTNHVLKISETTLIVPKLNLWNNKRINLLNDSSIDAWNDI